MKFLLALLITILPLVSHAEQEFKFDPKMTIGMGFYSKSETGQKVSYGQVSAMAFLFNNNQMDPNLSFDLLGLGLGYSDKLNLETVVSPLTLVFRKTVGISYDINTRNGNQGFSLRYQF